MRILSTCKSSARGATYTVPGNAEASRHILAHVCELGLYVSCSFHTPLATHCHSSANGNQAFPECATAIPGPQFRCPPIPSSTQDPRALRTTHMKGLLRVVLSSSDFYRYKDRIPDSWRVPAYSTKSKSY